MNVKINNESNETQQQVVSFADQNEQWMYSVDNQLDAAHRTLDSDDASLSNFFSRPIKIASINWTVGSVFGTTLNPWSLYFENPRVINRIANFNVLRSKLCVRIMINGNGFHYGRALASYRPLFNDDEMIAWRYGVVPEDIIGASQRMHVWIDPTKSQGGTLCLPFVWYKNGLNIPQGEWNQMGELDIASVTSLLHANGGTDAVTLSVFAWAEDVSLAVPTVVEPASLVPQAGEYEEVNKGPISGPASVVERVAGLLTAVPRIKPFALATQMAAGAIGQTAKYFGMSRPVDAGPITQYKPVFAGNFANTNVMDTSTKLTFDVKQELTIDPVAVGLGPDDEMAITSIAKRESYLTQFQWSTSAVPEDLLWNTRVTPMMLNTTTVPSGFKEYHMTPMAYCAYPFENWRGTINFRFQIVASSFHKGRIKIVYDPYYAPTTEYNTQYTHIIDLAKERDFTVSVQWGQELSFLDHLDNLAVPFKVPVITNPSHESSNGVLGVYVVNDLTTPSATLSDVSVLVSVSGGDDLEFMNPNGNNINTVAFFQPQAGEFEPQAGEFEDQAGELDNADNDLTTQESTPISTEIEHTFATDNTVDIAHKIHFGDPVFSIRQILKRYCSTQVFAPKIQDTGGGEMILLQTSNFPMYRGYDPNAETSAATPIELTPYSFITTTPLNYFTPLFLCRRGGLRLKYIFENQSGRRGIASVARITENGSSRITPQANQKYIPTSTSTLAAAANNALVASFSGAHAVPMRLNNVLEVELPFATKYRFAHARKKNVREAGSEQTQQHYLTFEADQELGGARMAQLVSTGEDFSLAFFQACPVFWLQDGPSPSVLD